MYYGGELCDDVQVALKAGKTPLVPGLAARVRAALRNFARIAVIDARLATEPALIRLVLENVGLPTDAPPPARARDPTALLAELDAN